MEPMSRWQSNPRGRLEQAALELFSERGYDQTTVAEIAARAGLTERTFFRHFSDKREVLFQGGPIMQELMADALAAAPPDATPLAAVETAITALAPMFDERHERSRARQGLIDAHPELQEREVAKMVTLAATLADSLRARGIPDPEARLTADMGMAVFRVAFAQWVRSDTADMRKVIEGCFDAMVRVVEAGR
jgi:AcrR family transcriptional regulator